MNSRRMAYPYTLGAKLAQFPYKLYFKEAWGFRMSCIAFIICAPLFIKITKLTKSPGNVQKFEQYKKKEHEEHLRHLEHLH